MQRAVRWLIATLVALGVLFGVWWLAELWGLVQEAAIGLAAPISAIAAAPFAYWATRTIPDTDLMTGFSGRIEPGNRLVTRRSAFLGALSTGSLGFAVGVVVALFAGSATNVLVWVGPGGPYPSSALPVTGEDPPPPSAPLTYLTNLEPLPESDSVFSEPQTIGSESFTKALYGATGCSDDVTNLTYRLDGEYVRFEAMAGPSGDSRSENSAVYTIYVDSEPVQSFRVVTGEARAITVDLTGASRLKLTWEDGNTGRCFTGQETVAVIGDPRLVGVPS